MSTEILSPSYEAFKLAHTGPTSAKQPLLINSLPVIPLNSQPANINNIFVHCAGDVRVTKATGQAWTPLTKIYWDDTAKNFTTTIGSNTLAGYAVEVAATSDVEGIIKLDPLATTP